MITLDGLFNEYWSVISLLLVGSAAYWKLVNRISAIETKCEGTYDPLFKRLLDKAFSQLIGEGAN